MDDSDLEKKIFGRRVGRTPLLRARKLEKELGIKEIYLKLEGINPTGHKCDRVALHYVKDAIRKKKDTLTIGTVGYLANSLGYLAGLYGLKCVMFVPGATAELLDGPLGDHVEVIETGGDYTDAVTISRKEASRKGWYDANPRPFSMTVETIEYSAIVPEIMDVLGEPPNSVSASVGEGSLYNGIYYGFRSLWASGDIEELPHLLGGTLNRGNAIMEAYRNGAEEVKRIGFQGKKTDPEVVPLLNSGRMFGTETLNAILDSEGRLYGFNTRELKGYSKMLLKREHVGIKLDSAPALGALVRGKQEGEIGDGKHVVVLSTGATDLIIERLTERSIKGEYNGVIGKLDTWLQDFTDPREEIHEAFDNALREGYVLGAFIGGELVGLCVLSRMPFAVFFPRYHLSYIAADDRYKGRGIGTELLSKAIELTDGDFTLHVETNNKKAIRVYRKMGMDVKYYRMHFVGKEGA